MKIKSLGTATKLLEKPIATITQLGSDESPKWSQTVDGLVIEVAKNSVGDIATVYKISTR